LPILGFCECKRDSNAVSALGTLRFELFTTEEAVRALVPQWDALLERSATNEPMLSPEWLLPWWEVYGRGTGRRLRVGAWFDGDRLVGLVLLQARTCRYRGVVPFRCLEFLGADVDEKDGVCSEYLNVLVERGAESAIIPAFIVALRDGSFGSWDELILGALEGSLPLSGEIETALTAIDWSVQKETITTAPFIRLPASWEEYLQKLGRHRRVIVKSQRDFDQWAKGDAQFHRADDSATLAEGLRILRALHAERWNEDGKDGAFHSPRFSAFHELVMPALLKRGALILTWMTVNGTPVSCKYSIRWNGKHYFYQSGRSMGLPPQVRVGIVLHAFGIRDAIHSGCREYDFLGGEAQYKSQLAPECRPLVQLRVVRSRGRERLRLAAEKCVDLVRPLRNWFSNRSPK